MTIKKFFAVTFLQLIMLIALKVIFYRVFGYQNPYYEILYWVATALAAGFLVRLLGVIQYLEAFFTAFVWLVLDLLMDYFITLPLTGMYIFTTRTLWVGYGFLILLVILVHNKRHIQIRKEHGQHGYH